MNYKLHYAPLDLNGQDIHCYEFRSSIETSAFILSETTTESAIVFLISIGNDIFISENISAIVKFFNDNSILSLGEAMENLLTEKDKEFYTGVEIEIHLQEYESYEDAYDVALEMREPNPLCYK
jgi:arginine/lysine/ornithine decarboxylase